MARKEQPPIVLIEERRRELVGIAGRPGEPASGDRVAGVMTERGPGEADVAPGGGKARRAILRCARERAHLGRQPIALGRELSVERGHDVVFAAVARAQTRGIPRRRVGVVAKPPQKLNVLRAVGARVDEPLELSRDHVEIDARRTVEKRHHLVIAGELLKKRRVALAQIVARTEHGRAARDDARDELGHADFRDRRQRRHLPGDERRRPRAAAGDLLGCQEIRVRLEQRRPHHRDVPDRRAVKAARAGEVHREPERRIARAERKRRAERPRDLERA